MRPSTVLVVDDDELSRQLLQQLLATDDHVVLFASNGAQALELARRATPDIVLLDILMPEIDGFEVCRQLRADPLLNQVPIVLLTTLEGREARLRGFNAGADDFLTKPVDSVELRARVRTITRLNRFRRLCEERARFEAAVAHSPDAIALTDGMGRLVHTNQAFVRLIGNLPPSIFDCFPPAALEALRESLGGHDAPPCAEPVETPLSVCAKPGTCVEVRVARLPSSEDPLLQFILRDVSERRQLEAQVLRLQRIELLGQVASGVVHDVNNLLMSVIGNADMLEADSANGTRESAREIRETAQRGVTLLRRILMFARGAEQSVTQVQMASVLDETARIAAKLVGDNITLTVEAPPHLPAVRGDAAQIHQVLMNLCVNGRDAMPEGGQLLCRAWSVSLTAQQARAIAPDGTAGDYVAVSVRDTGTGILPELRPRLFDPFFTTKPRDTSTGLGLATVLRIMRHHHGFIRVETEVGGGTCFTCYFPVAPARVAAA